MVVSPALQRGESGQKQLGSPVGAEQNGKSVNETTFMRLP
jgi:hypothetical protein